MFEDRSKIKFDFKKYDNNARVQTLEENQKRAHNMSEAQKKLFTNQPKENKKVSILDKKENVQQTEIKSPNYKYLEKFNNQMTVGEYSESKEMKPTIKEEIQEDKKVFDTELLKFDNNNNNLVKDEIKLQNKSQIAGSPKKNYSFRIKLIAGVYCILVALFGGWVIGNSIDIAKVNNDIHSTISKTQDINSQINTNIDKIVLKISQFDKASEDSSDLVVDMVTQTIDIAPEKIIQPNEYKVKSNWFDAFCNWLLRLFGGK